MVRVVLNFSHAARGSEPAPDLIRGRREAAGEGDRVGTLLLKAACRPDHPHPRCFAPRPLPLRACSKINESGFTVEQALSFCFERQLCRRADALICRRCLSGRG